MKNPFRSLYSTQQLRELDRLAVQAVGIPETTLMTRAGEAAFKTLRNKWPDTKAVAVVCGGGNNGGDGFVVARLAHEAGLDVAVILLGDAECLKNAARETFVAMQAAHVKICSVARTDFKNIDVIVDAIFGIGLDRVVTGTTAEAITKINASGKPVLAIDVPSGLNADTGAPLGIAVQADATATFIGLKQGLFTADGPDFAGEIVFDDLGIPKNIYENVAAAGKVLDLVEELRTLPTRNKNSHKGLYGHVLVIGGDAGMGGAVRLAGEAALRVGAGLVSLATHKVHAASLNVTRPEILSHAIENYKDLQWHLQHANVLAIGPGLGHSLWSHELFNLAVQAPLAKIVDADGLNLLALQPQKRTDWILTPHPKEAARLLDITTAAVQSDRLAAARVLQSRFGGVIVLKGCGTIVCYEEKSDVGVCPYGNPGMASGGMGDVLTGVIAGLVAQGLSLKDAAALGVCIHSYAADLALENRPRGLIATDVVARLREVVNSRAQNDSICTPYRS